MAHYVFLLLLISVVAILILLWLSKNGVTREKMNEKLQDERYEANLRAFTMPWEKAEMLILQSTVDGDIRRVIESDEYIGPWQAPPELVPLGERVGEMTAEEKACYTLVSTYGAKIIMMRRSPDAAYADLGNPRDVGVLLSRQTEVKGRLCISLTQRFSQYQKGEFPGVFVQGDFSVWTYASAEKRKAQ